MAKIVNIVFILIIFSFTWVNCSDGEFLSEDIAKEIARKLISMPLSISIESLEVIIVLNNYESQYIKEKGCENMKMANINISYNVNRLRFSDLTKEILNKMPDSNQNASADIDKDEVIKRHFDKFKEQYPSFDAEKFQEKKYKFKMAESKSITKRLVKSLGFGKTTASQENNGHSGSVSFKGSFEMKSVSEGKDDSETIIISTFDDKKEKLPMAKASFDWINTKADKVMLKKALWLDKENSIWVIVEK